MVYHLASPDSPAPDGTVYTLCGRTAQTPRVYVLFWLRDPLDLPPQERLCKQCKARDDKLIRLIIEAIIEDPAIFPPLRARGA